MATAAVSSAPANTVDLAEGAAPPLRADIAARLEPEQIAWLERRLLNRTNDHAIDYRVSSSILGRRFYVALMAGREMRSNKRLQQERLIRRFSQVAFEISIFCLAATFTVATIIGFAVGIVWLLDHALGITNLPEYLDKLFH